LIQFGIGSLLYSCDLTVLVISPWEHVIAVALPILTRSEGIRELSTNPEYDFRSIHATCVPMPPVGTAVAL